MTNSTSYKFIPQREIKDPMRYPKVQGGYENEMMKNYDSMIKVLETQIVKILSDN